MSITVFAETGKTDAFETLQCVMSNKKTLHCFMGNTESLHFVQCERETFHCIPSYRETLNKKTNNLRKEIIGLNKVNKYNYFTRAASAAFLWSAKNCAKPLSVNGCFNKPNIDDKGPVITSAPILAHSTMCTLLRIEAAKICVS